jgi:cystathionine gamma-synthase/cystathionine gamma-lyase/cystathionine beta-lyase
MGEQRSEHRMETLAVHAGEARPRPEGSVVFPIYQGTVFAMDPEAGYHDIQYLRLSSTPSQRNLHGRLAALEGGEAAVATSSGMAAITGTLIAHLKQGDHFLAADGLYGGTHDFVIQRARDLGLSYTLVDAQKPETWATAARPETRLFLVETISNPLIRVPPLDQVVSFARARGMITAIDNTFASPINFQPLRHGFDVCMHSATKYLNGHSDLVAGCVIGSKATVTRVRRTLNLLGGSLDPHAGFLLARGTKTLALRVRTQNQTATALARALAAHPKVEAVNYPGLETHPDHAHARRLLSGFGGMLSFRLRGGSSAVERLLARLEIPYHAPSLGGVETLIVRPAASSHAGLPPEERRRIGVTDDLLRVSCGIEHVDDLLADFRQALDAA